MKREEKKKKVKALFLQEQGFFNKENVLCSSCLTPQVSRDQSQFSRNRVNT